MYLLCFQRRPSNQAVPVTHTYYTFVCGLMLLFNSNIFLFAWNKNYIYEIYQLRENCHVALYVKKSIDAYGFTQKKKRKKKELSWNSYRFQGYLEWGIFPLKENDKRSCIQLLWKWKTSMRFYIDRVPQGVSFQR